MKKYVWLSGIIPMVICICIWMGRGVYPFGEQCILHMDMYHQYCPFFIEMADKLQNGGSLFYTWNLGLGSDFVALFAYYLASPLNLLLIFCPKDFVIEFMTVITLLKIGACGWSFFYFLKEHFAMEHTGPNQERLCRGALVFACAYALSGFTAAYSWNIMWMDSVALTPLIFLGLERLVRQGKCALYYVTLALSIWSNYYISIMICWCLVLYFFYLSTEGRWTLASIGKKCKAGLRFAWYSLLAGGTSAVLILPEILILSRTSSTGSDAIKGVEWYFHLLAELPRMSLAAEVYKGGEHWPNLYAGVFSIVLAGLFLLDKENSKRKKWAAGGMLAFFLLSFSNNVLDYVWHGFHFPNSLPARQSFLYIFLVLVMSMSVWMHMQKISFSQIGTVFVLASLLWIGGGYLGDSSVTDSISIGITLLFLLIYAMILALPRLMEWANKPEEEKKRTWNCFTILALIELVLNMAITGFSTTSRSDYLKNAKDYQTLLSYVEETNPKGAFVRVEDNGRMTKNDGCMYGYKGTTEFSSLMNIEVSHLYQRMYMEGGKNFYAYNGASPLTSALLSVGYEISTLENAESVYQTKVASSGDLHLYKKTYALPLGYMLPKDFENEWELIANSRISNLNLLSELLGAEQKMISSVLVDCEAKEGETMITIPEDGYYFAGYDKCTADTLSAEFGGEKRKFNKTTHRYLLEFGQRKAGDLVRITNQKNEKIGFTVYRINEDAIATAFASLSEQTMQLTRWTDTSVEGTIEVTKAGQLLFSIPMQDGWKLYVDGEETKIHAFKEALVSTKLEEGTHKIRLEYETPGFRFGGILSLICLFLAAVTLLLPLKFSFYKKELAKIYKK